MMDVIPIKKEIVCWTSPDGCSSCDHCGMDMDMDPYCVHPSIPNNKNNPFGTAINLALKTCKHEFWVKRRRR